MSTVTGIVGGALALASLQLVLSSQGATSAYGALATGPAAWLDKLMSSSIAGIPDHSITAPAASTSSSSAQTSSFVNATYAIPPPSSLPPVSSPPTLSV